MSESQDPSHFEPVRSDLFDSVGLLTTLSNRGVISGDIEPAVVTVLVVADLVIDLLEPSNESPFGRLGTTLTFLGQSDQVHEVRQELRRLSQTVTARPPDFEPVVAALTALARLVDLMMANLQAHHTDKVEARVSSRELQQGIERALDELRAAWDRINRELRVVESLSSAQRLEQRAALVVAEVEDRAEKVAEAAGTVSAGNLSEAFREFSYEESRRARFFQQLTVGTFLAAIIFAAVVAFTAKSASVEVGQKLAVTLPVLLLGGYFGRESAGHRRAERWASVKSVQLRTLDGYTAAMSPEHRSELWNSFGQRIFLDAPDATSPDKESDDVGDGSATLLGEATNFIRAAQGRR